LISRLLVANRGEIARRVFAACREAGISTVAVFSDPDADSPHVRDADQAVRLPGTSAAQTYLNGPAVVAAALAAGADAVHPGYGFLSEDPRFARQVISAGLTWVGPPPEAMDAMALKIRARDIAQGVGVPVLPELDPESVSQFPVLVKASAGGGGRGMRAVTDAAQLGQAIESARREAEAAFGDGTLFCEPLLIGARHIEVQVLADQAGTIWALTERDCSVQRRYAKVIEESPSPAVGPALRERLLAAAAALARRVGYVGAGTVEFLVDGNGEFYFLEFNTRLQVEHPVTECVHGVDLVALQIAIAEGQRLAAEPPAAVGHAIEARLYAEDPAAGFRPAAGRVHRFDIAGVDVRFSVAGVRARGRSARQEPGVAGRAWPMLRLDCGVEPGYEIPAHYDAMLAKVIAWALDRDRAVRRLATALASAKLAGPPTNRDLLVSVLADPVFMAGHADTSMLDGYDLAALGPSDRACEVSALAAAVAIAAANRQAARVSASVPGGFRNVYSQPQRTAFTGPRGPIEVRYQWTRTGGITPASERADANREQDDVAREAKDAAHADRTLDVVAFTPDIVTLEVDGVRYRFDITRAQDVTWVDSPLGSVRLTLLDRLPAPAVSDEPGSLLAPMPGSVVRLAAAAGDDVTAGQVVVVLEAMKMEHQVCAPATGRIAELRVIPGAQVSAGDILAIVVPGEAPEGEKRST
jgi:acyl-CoA carboxylase subunit alpha